MAQVKHRLNFRPNVGTVLLFAAGFFSLPCGAAYTIIDLPNQSIAAFVQPIATNEIRAQDVAIPFFESRVVLGPRGRRALADILPAVRSAPSVEIVGVPLVAGDTSTASARCNTIRGWFISHGVSNTKIRCSAESKTSPAPVDPGIVNSLVRIGQEATLSEQAAPKSVATQPVRSATSTSVPDPSEIDAIVRDFAANRISKEEALSRIFKTDIQQPPAMRRAVQTHDVVMTTPIVIPSPAAARTWLVRGGQTLKAAIEEWAVAAGWKMPLWEVPDPYLIESGYPFQGTLLDALTQLNELVPQLDFHVSLSAKTIRVTEKP